MTYFKLYGKRFAKLGLVSVISAFLIAGLVTGCTASDNAGVDNGAVGQKPSVQEPQVDKKAVMDEYNKLIANNTQPKEIFDFMDKNIKALTKEDAASIINQLEKLQMDYLPKMEEKFLGSDVQAEFAKAYLAKKEINNINDLESKALKDLVNETISNGYKVETAEGMFFPIVSYSAYKEFAQYLTDDLKEFVLIMSVESDKVPAKDAALVIEWNEVIDRALRQEAFIKKYPDSSKLDEVKELNKKYLYFTFFGLNNTPLFTYDVKVMNGEAKKAYMNLELLSTGDSELKQNLKGFMELLKNNGYKLTPEVEKYRNEIVGNKTIGSVPSLGC